MERIAGRLDGATGGGGACSGPPSPSAPRRRRIPPRRLLREVFDGPQASGWETRTLGELLNRYNEIIHPGDRKSGEAVFVGLEHIEPHTGRRISAGKVEFASMTGRKPTFKNAGTRLWLPASVPEQSVGRRLRRLFFRGPVRL